MLANVAALPAETVAGDEAIGRVLRETVRATRDQPPFAASAMDGWAVRAADIGTFADGLRIVGESAAGRGWEGQLAAGEAVRIATGAPLPGGADTVVMQEEAVRNGDRVRIGSPQPPARFVRPRGADFGAGDTLLTAGLRLDPSRIALAAAAGRSALQAGVRPRVVVVPTGDEVARPGTTPGPWQIFDSAGAGLAAWFAGRGCDVRRMASLPDDLSAVTETLRDVPCDLLVTIGGASVGDHDVVKPALAALGIAMIVDGVGVRPGKPTWFGVLPDGRKVLGLPGNPVSAMVCAELFAAGLVAAMQGAAADLPMRRARLASPLPENGPREHFARARLRRNDDGVLLAEAASDQDSSLVSVLAAADGLIRRLPHAAPAAAGDRVDLLMLGGAAAHGR